MFKTAGIGVLIIGGLILDAGPAAAETPAMTERGRISVAAVSDMVKKADTDSGAAGAAFAYLGGVIEATLAANEQAQVRLGRPLLCKKGEGRIDAGELLTAFAKAAPDPATWASIEATPILVRYVLEKYPCR